MTPSEHRRQAAEDNRYPRPYNGETLVELGKYGAGTGPLLPVDGFPTMVKETMFLNTCRAVLVLRLMLEPETGKAIQEDGTNNTVERMLLTRNTLA